MKKFSISAILLLSLSGCSKELTLRNSSYHIFFILAIIAIGILIYLALTRPSRAKTKQRLKKSNQPETDEKDEEESVVVTGAFDDFFPLPRKFNIIADPGDEDKYHRKLNYHYIIEKLTRKLYYLMIMISLLTITFAYLLYTTSLNEQITPDPIVMEEYKGMMTQIMEVEDELEDTQIQRVDRINSLSVQEANKIKSEILSQTIEYEDKLISEVNSDFFRIYYWRYALVRFLIAFIIVAFLRYLMVLYMRIRADRNDLIRKEEAMSILFYTLEQIKDKKKPFGKYGIDKIPMFPLRILFSSPDGKKKKTDSLPQFDAALENLIELQGKSIGAIERLAEAIEKK